MIGVVTAEADRRLAEAVKAACIAAAQQGYEEAAASGLCDEGAFEAAIGAVRMLDVEAVIAALPTK
jgi:hypothetical protein